MDLYGKSQIDLINDLGLNKSAVSTWCNGTRLPRMDKVNLLANYFHCNRSDLIEEKDNTESSGEPYYLNDETARLHRKHLKTQSCAPSSTLPETSRRNAWKHTSNLWRAWKLRKRAIRTNRAKLHLDSIIHLPRQPVERPRLSRPESWKGGMPYGYIWEITNYRIYSNTDRGNPYLYP